MKKQITTFIKYVTLALPMLMIHSSPASAEYDFEVFNFPGSELTQAFGINNAGKVTGAAFDGVTWVNFVYDMKKREYTTISEEFSPWEISNSGVMVGDVDGMCAIRDKKGNVTLFAPPSFGAGSSCVARGVNSNDKVSGSEIDADGTWLGFIYDSKLGTYEEFLPSGQTIAHGINAQGQNVGSVRLDADAAFPGSAEGRYAYLRQPDGAVKYFSISQSLPGQSRARGISESGLISGFYVDSNTFEFNGYVTTLSSGTEFEDITLTDDQVVYQKPCDVNVPPPPGPGYDLITHVFTSQVRNDGVVLGGCQDVYSNPLTDDRISYSVGLIATPTK